MWSPTDSSMRMAPSAATRSCNDVPTRPCRTAQDRRRDRGTAEKLVSGQGAELDRCALNQRRLVTQAIDARAHRVGRHALAGYGCCSGLVGEELPDTALDFRGIVGFRYEQAVIAQIACGFRGSGHPGGHDHFDAGRSCRTHWARPNPSRLPGMRRR